MMRVGLIADTHDLLRDEAIQALTGVDAILHAGDVCRPGILESLEAVAPVTAVEGNCDEAGWLPKTMLLEWEGVRLLMVHNLADVESPLAPEDASVLVCGHSHVPGEKSINGVRVINPGSAGRRRFSLPITVALLRLEAGEALVEWITLG